MILIPISGAPRFGAAVARPSGDTSGTADTAMIAGNTYPHLILAPGQWYINAPEITTSATWLQGSGPGTVVNVLAGQAGLTPSGVSQFLLSDMAFSIGSSAWALTVDGASDSHFWDLMFTGSSAAGGVAIDGDDATEQNWTDCVFRDVGGINFSYARTTTSDSGGMYLDRVRCVAPPSGATGGFSFKSTAAGVTPANLFMDQCVADSFYNDCALLDNISNSRISDSWFGLNSSANAGKVPLHITAGFNHAIGHCYTYQPLSGKNILIDGSAHEIQVGNGTVFDGAAGATALGLASAGGNFRLGSYYSYVGTLTDTPVVLGNSIGAASPAVFQTNGGGGSSEVIGIDDVSHPGNEIWLRNNNGALQLINTAYSGELGEFDQDGGCYFTLFGNQGGNRFSQGSGAPSKPGGVNPAAGDLWFRTDTPGTANQRLYVCTTGGATPVWSGIV